MPHVLLLSGPAGVGKSTIGWEVSAQLERAGVAHAVIDTDEFDRVVPVPDGDPLTVNLSERNLRCVWSNFAALGHTRLVLAGVMMHVESNLAWITAAVPGADVTVVRLMASEETLRRRLDVREIGSGKDEQVARTLAQLAVFRQQDTREWLVVETDGRSVCDIAAEIIERAGWCAR